MRDSMPILSALNLKEVHIKAWTNPNNPGEKYLEDKIPVSAFNAQGGVEIQPWSILFFLINLRLLVTTHLLAAKTYQAR